MIKNNKFLYITSSLMLGINALLWLIIAIIYASWGHYSNTSKIILFLQPLIYFVTIWGIWKKKVIVYWSIIFFILLNILLSFDNKLSLMKFIFVSGILAVVSLLLLHKDFVYKYKKTEHKK